MLIFNTFSGSVCLFTKEVWGALQKESYDNTIPYFDKMVEQGFIIPLEVDEVGKVIVEENIEKYAENNEKLSFVIAPTLQCNLRCVYCFESSQNNRGIMSEETIDNVVQYIKNSISINTKKLNIGWFGGEPLLAFDRIIVLSKKIKKICEEKNIQFTSNMITNGILFNKDIAIQLKEVGNLKKVQITLDGTEEEYCRRKNAAAHQFNVVLQNIKDCADLFNIVIRLNCDKNNYEDLLKITDILLGRMKLENKIQLYIAPIIDYMEVGLPGCMTFNETDEYKIRYSEYLAAHYPNHNIKKETLPRKKIFCGLKSLCNMAIGPKGELYKCEHDFGNESRVVGDVGNGLYYNHFFQKFIELSLSKKCRDCKFLPLCLGGCPSMRYDFSKENCIITESYIRHTIKQIIEQKG